ncbi:hypothetical protein HOO68_05030 [Candidatus Gracilibacteria bacterium]|nr:hypothetical protein [Candidatus Gracilibacteria bacterium]
MKSNLWFLIFLIFSLVFVVIFGMTTYRYYQAIHADDPITPYLSVETGKATISRGDIAIDLIAPESYDLQEEDIIITSAESLSSVSWPDHSVTRLGPNTRLTIQRMRVTDDYSKIELVAVLESGKVWSNIVRTLYPNSRVEFRLPKSGTVVGVRGTVFEINLDGNYIHSVEHNVTLQGKIGQGQVTLMPGEAVRVDNIREKILAGLDTAWASMNSIKDITYMTLRDSELRSVYSLLTGTSDIPDIWDGFVRWVLSWFSWFQDISIMTSMSLGNMTNMLDVPQETVMKWYQTFQSKSFVQERDQIRGTMISLKKQFTNGDQIIDSITRGALWDVQGSTGSLLKNSQILLDDYTKKTGTTLDALLSSIKKIDANSLTIDPKTINDGTRAIYDRFFQ